jgi:hypothetical protein
MENYKRICIRYAIVVRDISIVGINLITLTNRNITFNLKYYQFQVKTFVHV